MSEQGPPSERGKPQGLPGAGKRLNGHAHGHADAGQDGKPGTSVVVPFPKRQAPRQKWLSRMLAANPGKGFGAVLGWLAVLGFAGMVWGVSKDGAVDVIDVVAGLFGVLTALWFHRSR